MAKESILDCPYTLTSGLEDAVKRYSWLGARARKRIASGGVTAKGRPSLSIEGCRKLRAMLLKRAGYRCEFCGITTRPLEREHAIPRSRGGGDDWNTNWMTCSGSLLSCHRKKEAPYSEGRLVITVLGCGIFEGQMFSGTKRDPVPVGPVRRFGRAPTEDEERILNGLR